MGAFHQLSNLFLVLVVTKAYKASFAVDRDDDIIRVSSSIYDTIDNLDLQYSRSSSDIFGVRHRRFRRSE